jgi:hypothetical protein
MPCLNPRSAKSCDASCVTCPDRVWTQANHSRLDRRQANSRRRFRGTPPKASNHGEPRTGKPLKAKQIREAFNPVASLPPVNADSYRIADVLDERDRATVKRVRGFMESEIAPIIEDYWGRDWQRHPAGGPMSAVSLPTPRPSTPMKARVRWIPSSSGRRSPA